MERVPATMALIRFAGTRISWLRRFIVIPRSSRVSFRISPGCTGGSLSIVFGNFDMFGTSLPPREADAVLIIDSDAVLVLPVAVQPFQAIARRNQQIVQSTSTVKGNQPAKRDRRDGVELFDPFPLEKALSLRTPETPDHRLMLSDFTSYVKRTTSRNRAPYIRIVSSRYPKLAFLPFG